MKKKNPIFLKRKVKGKKSKEKKKERERETGMKFLVVFALLFACVFSLSVRSRLESSESPDLVKKYAEVRTKICRTYAMIPLPPRPCID